MLRVHLSSRHILTLIRLAAPVAAQAFPNQTGLNDTVIHCFYLTWKHVVAYITALQLARWF